MTGDFEKDGKSLVFGGFDGRTRTVIRPDALVSGNFLVLDIDPQPAIDSFRDGEYRF